MFSPAPAQSDGPLTALSVPDFLSVLEPEIQDLIRLSLTLYQRELDSGQVLTDYAHVVLPCAKAYEGFLKHYLNQLGLVSNRVVMSKKFRIGRALNPDVPPKQRDEWWLFDDLVRLCSRQTAQEMWESWLICRNKIVHFYPGQFTMLSLVEAGQHITRLTQAIASALACRRYARYRFQVGRQLHRNYVHQRL